MSRPDIRGSGMTSQRTRDRLVQSLADRGISNQAVLDAMRTTPRHIFIDEAMATRAYEDKALPIGFQQTISQPFIVALMTELVMSEQPHGRVLEIGTGCGYQTAILAQLVDEVYSIERIKPLLGQARVRLRNLKLRNVQLKHGDGFEGWPSKAPFDAIICTAAPAEIPDTFLEQLAPGGRLVIPVGANIQELRIISNTPTGFVTRIVEQVRFVPLLPGTTR